MYYSISGLLELCSFLVSSVAITILRFYVVASVFLFYPPRLFSFGTFFFPSTFPCPPLLQTLFFFSNESSQASNSSIFLEIRAHGGNLDISYTEIFSWDLLAGTYDTNTDDGRR